MVANHMMIQLSSPEVFLSHDWPSGVEQHGNLNDLLRRKPFFRGDIQSKQLGSPPLMSLLRNLKPSWWFAAHLHTRFEARVQHDPPGPPEVVASNPDEIAIGDEDDDFDVPTSTTAPQNPDEIVLENEIETVAPPPPAPRETKFLALDKCLPRRQFLEAGLFFFF
jgi:lariat debranching enzyme